MAPPSTKRAADAVTDVTAEDVDRCGVCFLPLKPPIFQCDVGHVICSSCRDRLAPAARCPVCRAAAARGRGGYRRDQAMKQPVESLRVPCTHSAAYGYAASRPAYHDDRLRHAPCHCPANACGFAAPTSALLAHFAAAHGWPCTTGACAGASFDVRLRDGINVVAVDRDDDFDVDGDQDHAAVASRYLLVLDVQRKPFGRAVLAFCISPRGAAAVDGSVQCQVALMYSRYTSARGGLVRCYHQRTDVDVACTDLSDGLPDADDCFQAAVLKSVDRDDEDTVEVTVRVTIH